VDPASVSLVAGAVQTYRAIGYTHDGKAIGDVTPDAKFEISPDGNCSGATCSATTAGTHTVTVTLGDVSTSVPVSVAPAAPARLEVIDGDQQSTQLDHWFPKELSARLVDSYGNPLPGVTVKWTVTTGSAHFAGVARTVTSTTDPTGLTTAESLAAGSAAGPVTVTASIGPVSRTYTLTGVAPDQGQRHKASDRWHGKHLQPKLSHR
jgi:hypothetical protein